MDSIVKEVSEYADKLLKTRKNLSEAEAFDIAVKMQRNRMFRDAHVLDRQDNPPAALEAIAIALGFTNPY